MIRFLCPACKSAQQAPEQLAGRVALCGKCRQRLRVPNQVKVGPQTTSATPTRKIIEKPIRTVLNRPRRSFVPIVLIGVLVVGAAVMVGLPLASLTWRGSPAPMMVVELAPSSMPQQLAVLGGQQVHWERLPAPQEEVPSVSPAAAPAGHPPEHTRQFSRLLATLNRHRQEEGHPPVQLDEQSCKACRAHALYLRANLIHNPHLDLHDQDSTSEESTPIGKAIAGRVSVVVRDAEAALEEWLQKPAHRAWLMDPKLRRIGVASIDTSVGQKISVFDWISGRTTAPRTRKDPVVYPVPSQQDVPLAFPGNEIPDPLPEARNKVAGYPITITFPEGVAVPDARGWLEDETGGEVPFWFSSPVRPANKEYPREQQNTVCLIAHAPLRPGTRYVVRLEAQLDQAEWAAVWSFTTLPASEFRQRIYQRALDRLNNYRRGAGLTAVQLDEQLSQLCQEHAQRLAVHLEKSGTDKGDVPSLIPEKASEQQRLIATRSLIRTGGGSGPVDAIDWIFESVLNRHLALNPSTRVVAMGAVQLSPRGWIWVIHIPTLRRDGDGPTAILYPSKEQQDVPLYFGRPINSIVGGQAADGVAGFPITANFFPHRKVTDVEAELLDVMGERVQCWLSTPEKTLPGTGNYRQILLLPRRPLEPATPYQVRMRAIVDGERWSETWRFTTLDNVKVQAATVQRLLEAVNKAREQAGLPAVELDKQLSDGCKKHAAYLVRNIDHPKVQGLGIHEEAKELPGYSAEGARAGQASVIAVLPDPSESVNNWMATLYHRIPLLDPRLKRIGYGQAQHPSRGWVTVLDVGQGK